MKTVTVWDPVVRLFHWLVVIGFFLDMTILGDEGRPHEVVGYIVLGLVGVRIIWGLIGTKYARFSAFPPSFSAARKHLYEMARGLPDHHRSHNPLGALMVYNMLISLILLGVTGYMSTSTSFWGVRWVSELHEVLASWTLASVGLHIAAVVLLSRRTGVNLVKAMVTGKKTFKDED